MKPRYHIMRLYFLLASIFFLICYFPHAPQLDHLVAQYFFASGPVYTPPKWALCIYTYGLLPGQILGCAGIFLTIFSFFPRFHTYKPISLFLSCSLLIGPVFLCNSIGKRFFIRPRPKQTLCYGGKFPYIKPLHIYREKTDRHLRSMPSGHVALCLYLYALTFIGKYLQKRSLFFLGIFLGTILSPAMALSRFAQGGHYLSDVIASFVIMSITFFVMEKFFLHRKAPYAQLS